MANLKYSSLELQEYLKLDKCNANQAKIMCRFRCRMEKFSENYSGPGGTKPCPLCGQHLDNQETSFECKTITENIQISEEYSGIFSQNIPASLFETTENILSIRENLISK